MNTYTSISFVVSVICTIVLVIYPWRKQAQEAFTRGHDQFSRLRWIIFALLTVSIIVSGPTLYYQYIRFLGEENNVLRAYVTIASRIGQIANTVLLVLVYNYKIKDD